MARYIDVEVLKSRLEDFSRWCKDGRKEGVDFVIDCHLPDIPTADVQEVRRGHWIEKDLDNFRKVECSCSICGWSGVENYDSYVDIHDFELCPNCGAKMDWEEE